MSREMHQEVTLGDSTSLQRAHVLNLHEQMFVCWLPAGPWDTKCKRCVALQPKVVVVSAW